MKRATNKMMLVKPWPLLDTFPLQYTTFIFVQAGVRKYPQFQLFRSGQNLSWADWIPQSKRTLWVASLLNWGLSWAHPEKSTKSFPEQRITRIFQDQSHHKYLWEPNILLFNEQWSWMNEWSFQWSPTFSSSSGVGYFKQNTKMLFNVMLILGHLMSTEIFNIIF